MRLSNFFLPTLREAPAEAEVPSHIFLLRAGYIRQLAAGIYSYLPLAQRSLLKIQNLIRQEMNAIGGQEFHLPAMHPAEIWRETGRWDVMGDNMFRLKDRWGRDMCLGMTHEEIFTKIAQNELRSYKQLPQIWYQIQTKFRDELRPKSGLLRVRQFTMKDSYTFDISWEDLDKSYNKHYDAYCRIFTRCGLEYSVVEAHSGSMGGSQSHEFMVRSDAGEDLVATCNTCNYAANLEKAVSRLSPVTDDEPASPEPVKVSTPGQKTIEEISNFLGVAPENQIKSLVYMVESEPVLILMRGDHQLNEMKLEGVLETGVLRPALPEEIRKTMGADAGSLGPVGVKNIRILADEAILGRKNMTTGANEDDFHIQGVAPEVHFKAEYHDFRTVQDGEVCPECGARLSVVKTIESGHIFKLGTKYSDALDATVLDSNGKAIPIVMGSYGIGVERILSAAIELYHDEKGMILPVSIAPFEVIIVPVSVKDEKQKEVADVIYDDLLQRGIDVLCDDRNERAGVKFNDADLIGVPIRITIGQKKLKENKVEINVRRDGSRQDCPVDEVVEKVVQMIADFKQQLESKADALDPRGAQH